MAGRATGGPRNPQTGDSVLAQNVYECLFLFDSNKYARDPRGVANIPAALVEKIGGELLASRLWVEQKLAYPIEGHRKGTYWLTYFRADSSKVAEFNRLCRLDGNILRHLVLKIDPRIADTLVAHALGKAEKPRPQIEAVDTEEDEDEVDEASEETEEASAE